MGNYIKYFFLCLKCRNRFKTKKIDEGSLEHDDIDIANIAKNEFYCHECEGNEIITEVLKIHSDNGKIKLKCQNKKNEFDLTFEEYCEKAKNRTQEKCKVCKNNDSQEERKATNYCLGCEKYYCKKCGIDHIAGKIKENKEKQKSILVKFIECLFCVLSYIPCLTNILRDKDEHKLILIRQITSYCLEHNLETTERCMLCKRNVCQECLTIYHKWHDKPKLELSCKNITNFITNIITFIINIIINIISCSSKYDEEILKARKIIYDKGQKLLKMKEFYEMIKSASDSNKNIKTYKDNLTAVSKCIENEKKRDNKEIDLVFYKLEQLRNRTNNPDNSNNEKSSKKESNDINDINDDINNIKEYA